MKKPVATTAQDIIARLGLEPMPQEGGFYRETYRCAQTLPTDRGPRACCTAIYYLVTPESFSTLHRVAADELFHFHAGDPVEMFQLWEDGAAQTVLLGADVPAGLMPQVVVPADVWQGTRLRDGGAWALLTCTVAPGFELADFEAGDRAALTRQFPHHAAAIARFTRS